MFLPGPVLDDLLPVRPIDAIRGGSAEGISLIIGTNMHEGTMFVHPENTGFPNSWTMIVDMMERNGYSDSLDKIIGFYHEKAGRPSRFSRILRFPCPLRASAYGRCVRQIGGDPFIRFATDYAFEMPSVKVASGALQHSENVWMYRYELVTKSGTETGWKASHAFELPVSLKSRIIPSLI